MRGQKIYRAVLIMPYAIPGFISLLVWASFFNRDFGLINDLTGLNINWFGETWNARAAVLLTNLWMGFPYMFLVCTGALQAIPSDLREAAKIDGASGWKHLTKIIFPLMLVSVAPLLVASFAFNFNNFNADPAAHRGRAVLAGQPDGRRHRHPDQLHDPAGLRRRRRADRLRLRGLGRCCSSSPASSPPCSSAPPADSRR